MIVFLRIILFFPKYIVTFAIAISTLQLCVSCTSNTNPRRRRPKSGIEGHKPCFLNWNTMSEIITHTGVIDSIDGEMVRVRIVQHSACSSCKVASYCSSAESKEKIIDVHCTDGRARQVGNEVTVMAAQSVGMKAVLMAFVIPLALILTTIAITLKITNNELTSALAGVAILIPYYILLYVMRSRIERELTFYLE
jgi:sigma-E factor negative regulatory protein RseC